MISLLLLRPIEYKITPYEIYSMITESLILEKVNMLLMPLWIWSQVWLYGFEQTTGSAETIKFHIPNDHLILYTYTHNDRGCILTKQKGNMHILYT